MKKVYINESKMDLLKEGMSSVLYHFTSLDGGYGICKDDRIYLQSSYAKDADNYDKKRKYYLSCTRMRNSQFGYSKKFSRDGVRIELDGDALAAKFKGRQVNYWGGGTFTDKYKYMSNVEKDRETDDFNKSYQYPLRRFKKDNPNASEDEINNFIAHNFNDDAQHHVSNESEDRIFSYDPLIMDAHKYIKSVDVLLIDFENNPDKMNMAQAFKFKSKLRSLVRVFDSEKEFNNPNGKDANDNIEYGDGLVGDDSNMRLSRVYDALEGVICFIAFGNPQFEGNKFGKSAMELLKKYELSEFKGQIGKIIDRYNHMWGGINGVGEKLDAVRRDLSDRPNEYTWKISKMITDYFKSIGANSFREAFVIKKGIAEDYYNALRGGYVYDRVDTSKKYRLLVIDNRVISLYPNEDKFIDVVRWNTDGLKSYADAFAYEAMYEDGYNTSGSKNYNSMFQYIYKLFRKGTVAEVFSTLEKIGFNQEYLNSWNIGFEYEDLDYWDAVRYNTVNSNRLSQDDNVSYSQMARIRDKEIEDYMKKKQKAQQ